METELLMSRTTVLTWKILHRLIEILTDLDRIHRLKEGSFVSPSLEDAKEGEAGYISSEKIAEILLSEETASETL